MCHSAYITRIDVKYSYTQLFESVRDNHEGQNASYIPDLAEIDPELYPKLVAHSLQYYWYHLEVL